MVRALHAAGLEVLLDVVYNHSGEGDVAGPTLAFRGLDNRGWYRLDPADRARYRDMTGCGNTVDLRVGARAAARHRLPALLGAARCTSTASASTSRRPWPGAATTSTRGRRSCRCCSRTRCSPTSSSIAEPWDVGPGGYQVGRFPPPWAEWNDQYRDTVRDAWRGHGGGLRSLAYRLSGSSDLFFARAASPGRRSTSSPPTTASRCTTSRRTTPSTTRPTARTAATARRRTGPGTAASRARPTTRPCSRCAGGRRATCSRRCCCPAGVPMLTMGDEVRRTQSGNNNAYCQDSPLSWQPWDLAQDAARPARLHGGAGAAAARAPGVPAGVVLPRPARASTASRTSPGSRRPATSSPTATGSTRASARSGCTSTGRASACAARAASGSSTTASCWCCTRAPRDVALPAARRALGGRRTTSCSTPASSARRRPAPAGRPRRDRAGGAAGARPCCCAPPGRPVGRVSTRRRHGCCVRGMGLGRRAL